MYYLLAILVGFSAGAIDLQSPIERVNLVELYTSEGCNSCPPADRWLSSFTQDGALWARVVPLAFHVDYWNHLGWRDRFSQPQFGQRQRWYQQQGAARGVYTPGVFLNGREWRSWTGTGGTQFYAGASVGVLSMTYGDGVARLRFVAHDAAMTAPDRAYVALLAGDVTSDVAAGENRGKRLLHDFVVLNLTKAPLVRDGTAYRADLTLPSPSSEPPIAVAAWIVDDRDEVPIQAVGGWLKN